MPRRRTAVRYVREAGRRSRRGGESVKGWARRGTVKEVAGGVGGGFIASVIANRALQGRPHAGTIETVAGLGASWLVGGWKGLLGYAVFRFATTGFNIGGQQVGFAQSVQGGGAPALGVRVLQ